LKTFVVSYNTIVAVLLSSIAEDFGVTHGQIATYIGTSRSTVSKTLSGQIEISANRLKFILLAISKLKRTKADAPDSVRLIKMANELEHVLSTADKLYTVNVTYESVEPTVEVITVVKMTLDLATGPRPTVI
jgi:transcriptional regulator with XRE-family HTH domain